MRKHINVLITASLIFITHQAAIAEHRTFACSMTSFVAAPCWSGG